MLTLITSTPINNVLVLIALVRATFYTGGVIIEVSFSFRRDEMR
jgi:hypothetical protein